MRINREAILALGLLARRPPVGTPAGKCVFTHSWGDLVSFSFSQINRTSGGFPGEVFLAS